MAVGTGSGIATLVLMLVLGSSGLAAHAAVVIKAPYKGGVSPNSSVYIQGCGKLGTNKQWVFHLLTGAGGSSSAGSANACAHSIYGVGATSNAQIYGGIEVVLPLKVPAGSTNVSVSQSISYSVALKAADGSTTGKCTANLYTYYYTSTDWEWNWTGSYFGGFAYTYSDFYSGIWYNYTYNTASIPSPFNFNNTTYYSHYTDYGQYGGCQASSFAETTGSVWMVDETTGGRLAANGTTMPAQCSYSYCAGYWEAFYTSINIQNYTDWYCYSDYYWDGPYNTSYGSNVSTCYSYNKTLTAEVMTFTPGSTSTSCYGFAYPYLCTFYNATSTLTWSNSSAATGSTWFDYAFTAGDHYALFLEVFSDAGASQSWAHGSASWNINELTLGHGWKVNSVTIT